MSKLLEKLMAAIAELGSKVVAYDEAGNPMMLDVYGC